MSIMRAVTVTEFGSPGVLEIRELPTPDPAPGQVRIAVAAAGLNPVDAYNVEDPSWAGVELGFIPGYDIAGTVDAVGAGVDPTLVGQRAMAMTPFPKGQGGYAEYAVVDESLVGYLADDADLQAAASIPLAAGTASEAVGKVADAGPHVLVIGASGGVGLFALQFARASRPSTGCPRTLTKSRGDARAWSRALCRLHRTGGDRRGRVLRGRLIRRDH